MGQHQVSSGTEDHLESVSSLFVELIGLPGVGNGTRRLPNLGNPSALNAIRSDPFMSFRKEHGIFRDSMGQDFEERYLYKDIRLLPNNRAAFATE